MNHRGCGLRAERLFAGRGHSDVNDAGGRRPFALPGSRPHFLRDRTCDVRHVRLDLTVDIGEQRVSGTCSLTLTPLVDGTRQVELDAVELEVESVTREDGTPL